MFSFCGSKGMLILYVYREEDRKSNGDAEQNRRRDLSGKTKKKKRKIITSEHDGTLKLY